MMNSLILIGEKINYSIPQTGRLLDVRDYPAIQRIARVQEEQGADYIDVNVGPLPPEVMKAAVAAVQSAVDVQLCIDSTDPAMLEAGIGACAADVTGPGAILNSAIESNAQRVLGLRQAHKCQVVLLVSERLEEGALRRNSTAGEAYATAKRLFLRAKQNGFAARELFVDPGTPAIASDMEGLSGEVLNTIDMVRRDPDMEGIHILIGVSNFTAGLPRGLRLPLQNAFLTLAVERGLDTVIADPGKKRKILESGDPYLVWLRQIMDAEGTGRIEALTSSPIYREAAAAEGRSKRPGSR